MKRKFLICSVLSVSILSTSCLGSFSAFNSLRDWNDGLTENKFLDNLIFWALNIAFIYPLFIIGDVVFFNLLEFWTGSNPIAMAEGESETQYATVEGQRARMTAKKNEFHIQIIEGNNVGKELHMLFLPEDKSWNAIGPNGELKKLASIEDGFYHIYTPEGDRIKLDANASEAHNMAILEHKLEASNLRYAQLEK